MGSELFFTAFYGYNTVELIEDLWSFIAGVCQGPSSYSSDFNSLLFTDGRLNGNPVTEADIKGFSDCMQLNCLSVVRTVGSYFTWCNNQDDRIDWCVANSGWFSQFAHVVAEVLERNISDHCPD